MEALYMILTLIFIVGLCMQSLGKALNTVVTEPEKVWWLPNGQETLSGLRDLRGNVFFCGTSQLWDARKRDASKLNGPGGRRTSERECHRVPGACHFTAELVPGRTEDLRVICGSYDRGRPRFREACGVRPFPFRGGSTAVGISYQISTS